MLDIASDYPLLQTKVRFRREMGSARQLLCRGLVRVCDVVSNLVVIEQRIIRETRIDLGVRDIVAYRAVPPYK